MAEKVDISGLNKVDLLEALWNNAQSAIYYQRYEFGIGNDRPPSFSRDGEEISDVKKYIDYFDGRCIRTDISGDSANPSGYDKEWGQGAFRRVVDGTR